MMNTHGSAGCCLVYTRLYLPWPAGVGSCLTGRSQTATSSAGQVALRVGRAMGPSGLAEKLLQAPWVWALAGGGGLGRIIPHLHPNGLH